MFKIASYGYGNSKTNDELIQFMKDNDLSILVDVRMRPKGWATLWSKPYLEKKLPSEGLQYLSVPTLGNTTGTAQWIPPSEIDAQETLEYLVSLLKKGENICLMCAEKDYKSCHRTSVAETLSQLLPDSHIIHWAKSMPLLVAC